jgi:hypothetical protein
MLALLAALFLYRADAVSVISEHTLRGPFSSFDSAGMRKMDGWNLGGFAAFHENFLRLTNDRQSRRGTLWNTHKLERDEWSTTLRFRISGQGKKLFGDGLALWVTGNSQPEEGPLHGMSSTFKGFGIILDT